MFRLQDLRLSLLVGSSAANAGIRAGSWNHRHASSLTLAHTHGPGTRAEAGHVHGVGSLLVDLHGHSLSRENTIALNDSGTQKDSGQYALDCSSATRTSNQGSGQRALGGTMAGPSSATVSGATAQQSNTAISGSAGPANPPYQTLNYIVKAA